MNFTHIFTACPGVWSAADYQGFHKTSYKKADPKNFRMWWSNQEASITSLVTPCKKDSRWGVIRLNVTKKKDGKTTLIQRKYVICLDLQSDYIGNLYYADSKLAIYGKIFFSILSRPVHLLAKMVYHAAFIGFTRAIIKGIHKNKPIKEICKSAVCNLVDIVRTPIFEVALVVISLAGLLAIPFNPMLAYDFRAAIGQLSHELYWGKKYHLFIDLTPCMRRRVNIMDLELNRQKIKDEYIYSDESNPTLVALENNLKNK